MTTADGSRDRRVVADPGAPPPLGAVLRARHEPADFHRPRPGGPLRTQRDRAGAPQWLRLLRHLARVAARDGLPTLARETEASLRAPAVPRDARIWFPFRVGSVLSGGDYSVVSGSRGAIARRQTLSSVMPSIATCTVPSRCSRDRVGSVCANRAIATSSSRRWRR